MVRLPPGDPRPRRPAGRRRELHVPVGAAARAGGRSQGRLLEAPSPPASLRTPGSFREGLCAGSRLVTSSRMCSAEVRIHPSSSIHHPAFTERILCARWRCSDEPGPASPRGHVPYTDHFRGRGEVCAGGWGAERPPRWGGGCRADCAGRARGWVRVAATAPRIPRSAGALPRSPEHRSGSRHLV